MRICRILLLILALSMTFSSAHAEGNCPPGYYPTGAPQGQAGPQGCAPIPSDSSPSSSPSLSPPPEWQDHWGAIATDGLGGHLGVSTDAWTKATAEAIALADCKQKGGLGCQVENTYVNACVAMILGDDEHSSSSAPTRGEAIALGLKTCKKSDKHCLVFYTACSLPVRVR